MFAHTFAIVCFTLRGHEIFTECRNTLSQLLTTVNNNNNRSFTIAEGLETIKWSCSSKILHLTHGLPHPCCTTAALPSHSKRYIHISKMTDSRMPPLLRKPPQNWGTTQEPFSLWAQVTLNHLKYCISCMFHGFLERFVPKLLGTKENQWIGKMAVV